MNGRRWDEALAELMQPMDQGLFAHFGNKVLTGPFTGMQIPSKAVWNDGNTGHKLLGGYEHELHVSIEKAIAREPRTVVNVGSAEGYYAIGMARRLPNALVHAFDIDERSLALLDLYAKRNWVEDRICILEGCNDAQKLDDDYEGHTLYVADCEGAEFDLFNPELCPRLKASDLIIECHDYIKPECSAVLQQRFSATHDIEVIKDQPPELYSFLVAQPMVLQVLYATDIRPAGGCWIACWARKQGV
jgi:hypothetical protein